MFQSFLFTVLTDYILFLFFSFFWNADDWLFARVKEKIEITNGKGQILLARIQHGHLLVCKVSLMWNIVVENADDHSPQKGPLGMQSTFPPSAFRMWVRVMLATKEFPFLDLHDLVVVWLTSVRKTLSQEGSLFCVCVCVCVSSFLWRFSWCHNDEIF